MEVTDLMEQMDEDDTALVSRLHPDAFDHKHIDSLHVFVEDLNRAVKNSFPNRGASYTGVYVLLLRWSDDDLGVQAELSVLRRVLDCQFNFTVETWDIPSSRSTFELQRKLYDFQFAHQSETELLIVYYGGHGDYDRRGRSIWRANQKHDSPHLIWSSLQHLLENAMPHVLIILDCCFAANAARDTAEGSSKEILAACGRGTPTLGVGERSFTQALIDELRAFGDEPFTVAMLHCRLVTIRWRLASTPIYASLSEKGQPSIVIAPHVSPLAPNAEPSSSGQDDSDSMQVDTPATSISSCTQKRVLVSLSVAENAPLDVGSWLRWLTHYTPKEISDINVCVRIESVYSSQSTLVIVSMPVPFWDLLPDRQAYGFIDFIDSGNFLVTNCPSNDTHEIKGSHLSWCKGFEVFPRTQTTAIAASSRALSPISRALHDESIPPVMFELSRKKRGRPSKAEQEMRAAKTTAQSEASAQLKKHKRPSNTGADVGKTGEDDGKRKKLKKNKMAFSPPPPDSIDKSTTATAPETRQSLNAETSDSSTLTTPLVSYDYLQQPLQSRRTSTQVQAPDTPPHSTSWKTEDDTQLTQARAQGLGWSQIAQNYFPNKTPNACRKRNERLMENQSQRNWDSIRIEALAIAYAEVREEMWKLLAVKVGEKWLVVESKCMEEGVKTLLNVSRHASHKPETKGHDENDHDGDSGIWLRNV